MGLGSSKSKKAQNKEAAKFFERERWKEQKLEEKKKKKLNPIHKRGAVKEPPLPLLPGGAPPVPPGPAPAPAPPPAQVRSYDDEALDRMRYQLHNDSDAFLLNNILLSVQFFENYERELLQIKRNPISEREHAINEAMVRHHKHVFFADKLQECVHEHVYYQWQRGQAEPLTPPRLFVIYDNVEASEPGDTSDYSAVLDAPFYKLCIEDCKEQGFVKLKKLEVLESALTKENEVSKVSTIVSDDSVYSESEKESIDSDEFPDVSKGEDLLHELKTKFIKSNGHSNNNKFKGNPNLVEFSGRNRLLTKQVTLQVEKSNISNISNFQKVLAIPEETENVYPFEETEAKPRKSNLKTPRRPSGPFKEAKGKQYADISKSASENTISEVRGRRPSGPTKEVKNKQYIDIYKSASENTIPEVKSGRRPSGPTREVKNKQYNDIYKAASESIIAEDTETSGYRSTSSSRQNESSETESDYGYSTITESATPRKLELSEPSNYSVTSGVLPEECWNPVQVRTVDGWSEDDDEELDDSASKSSLSRDLYETFYFLSSMNFMNNFVDNFIINLGSGLGISEETINSALTQGASIYCDTTKTGTRMACEIYPALIAGWPNAANQWIIRERRIIQSPRTNFSYQWPTKDMVLKAVGFGCLLVPIGFRPKRGLNPDQLMQWRMIFPAAERYLESFLAHSHMRCYLFALTLHKTFMEVESAKIGIDASHIKNHLFWQCEDNYAKWPEDRLGESLRLFLRTFYVHFGQGRFPNYFIESCNDFKSIPKPLLMKIQRRLADILESPVMHVLAALNKLKYTKKDFYPKFNCYRLYEILTCKNPLRILNPNLPIPTTTYSESSDSEEDRKRKMNYDKNYHWKKQRQRQIQERRNAQMNIKKQRTAAKQERQINAKIILPTRMEAERRRLVLDFFITHFIAMARSSEKFEAIKQAVIYLEQAQRLCVLLREEPGGDSANEYMDVIRDKLADCQRKLVNQGGYKLPRRESQIERSPHRPIASHNRHPRYEHIVAQDSPTENHGISAFTFVDVHSENSRRDTVTRLNDAIEEESKL